MMIASLDGKVIRISSSSAVIEVNGVGYLISCTPATAMKLTLGENIVLMTSLLVREDAMMLYGFLTDLERQTFELVLSASGIGPKIALAVLSVFTPNELTDVIRAEDYRAITKVPGIGPKGAQRMVLELKDKINILGIGESGSANTVVAPQTNWQAQVSEGLIGLGWTNAQATAACREVYPLFEENPQISISELMKQALRSLAKQ